MLVPYIYNHELQLHLYQTISHKWVNLGITPFLPLCKKEIYTMERKLQVIFIILAFCQTIKMDIEPCANSMWTEGVIRDCYAGQAKKIEGLARLSLQMMLEKPYVLASYCQCQPSESEQLDMWKNLTARLTTKFGYFRPKCKVPLHPVRRNQNFIKTWTRRQMRCHFTTE